MIKFYQIQNGTVSLSDNPESPIRVFISPTQEEIESLKAATNVNEHTLSSALDTEEIPRLEIEEDHFAIIWKHPQRAQIGESIKFEVFSIGLFVFADSLEIVLPEETQLFDGKGFHRITSINDALLHVLSRGISHFLGHLRVIDLISNEIKEKINKSMENKYLLQMLELSESLVYYLNAISSNGAVLDKLRLNAARLHFSPNDFELLDDVQIDNNQCYKQADIFSSILTGLMDTRGTIVNNNVNSLLRKLTMINTIFLPLNLIASIGGMSEFSAATKGIHPFFAYSLLAISMLGIGFLTLLIINPSSIKSLQHRIHK